MQQELQYYVYKRFQIQYKNMYNVESYLSCQYPARKGSIRNVIFFSIIIWWLKRSPTSTACWRGCNRRIIYLLLVSHNACTVNPQTSFVK
jgi:hypothetical protein